MGIERDKKERITVIVLWICSILVNIKSIFVDFDVDSAYAMTMSYRNIMGDGMFTKMWEPHQTSGFFLSILEYPYFMFKHQEYAEGLAIYLQTLSVLFFFAVVFLFHRFLKKRTTYFLSHIIPICLFVFRPKQLVIMEFSNMLMFFSLILFMLLIKYFETERWLYLVLAAVSLCLCVLSYPSALLIYFALIPAFILYSNKKVPSIICFTIVCLLIGCAYVGYFLYRMGLKGLLAVPGNIFSADSSHSESQVTTAYYFQDTLIGFSIAAGCFLLAFVISRAVKNKIRIGIFSIFIVLFASVNTVLLFIGEAKGADRDNFAYSLYTVIFLILIVFGIIKGKNADKPCKRMFYTSLMISGATFIAVVLLTNQPISTAFPYLIIASFMSLICVNKKDLFAGQDNRTVMIFPITVCIFMILYSGLTIRDNAASTSLIFGVKNIVRKGPEKGIVAGYMSYYKNLCDYDEFAEHIHDNESLLIVTNGVIDSSLYLYRPVNISHYSTISTSTYDEHLQKYWEIYPEKIPDVIAAEFWYGEQHTEKDSWIMDYIEDNYYLEYEGNYWRYYRRKQADLQSDM